MDTDDTQRDELATLRLWLDDARTTVSRKTDGLDAAQLAIRAVPPSTLSLLGLVRHLAQMEHHWFSRVLQQSGEPSLFVVAGHWDSQFDDVVADPALVEEAFAVWRRVIVDTDVFLDGIDASALDHVLEPGDRIATIRDVLQQVLKEYARHAGHMDLLRECIDGVTGE